ncbi:MAG: S8 family serine peptidase, partial [Pseudomonadota bacterium]
MVLGLACAMLANIGSAADGSSGSERVIVRFDSAASVNPTLLTREGAAILQYLSNHAYLVRLQGAEAKAIAGLPGVMEVRPQPDGHRIAASLVAAAKRGATLQRLTVLGARGQSPEAFRDTLGRILPADTQVSGARLLAGQPMVEVQASAGEAAATLAALADSESVIWIEGAPSVEAYNSDSVGPLQANRESGGAIPVVTPIWDQGLFGTGQIVTVMDGGLDRNEDFFLRLDRGDGPVEAITDATTVAPDDPPGPVFPERKVYGYWVDPASSPYDSLGDCVDPPTAPNVNGTFHGTHVTGTVLGDALTPSSPTASGYDPDDGMAPNAQVLFIDVGNDETRCVTEARNFTARAAQMTAVGSYLFNGSFGGRNPQAYSAYAAEADDAAYEFEDVLFVFAAGNRGEPESIGHPAVAKSVLAVGGTYPGLDERPYWNTSIGPALDGRIKPDIVAPGVRVRSANGNDRDDNPLPPFGNNPTTAEKSGTSMAAPQVTGGAALARQYFAEGFYPTGARNPADARVPSGALLKALLVNGAHPIGDLPNMTAGFGRVWLDNALFFEGDDRDLRLWDMRNAAGLETGESIEFPIRIEAGQELRATLAWYDPPGSPMAARALVNDLDLELVGNGATWRGNSHTRGESTTDGEPDRLNTVEQIRLSSPEAGDYLLRVRAHGVPGDGRPETRRQGFSLVVNAAQCASGVTAPPAFELAASEEEIDLSIQPLANAERFEVYRASGTCEASSGRGRLLGTTTSAFSDSKVVAGGEYAYTVRGVDGCGEGPVSVCKSIVAKGPPESDVSGPWFNATQSGHGWLVEQLDGI